MINPFSFLCFSFLLIVSCGTEYTVCECYMVPHNEFKKDYCRDQFKHVAWQKWNNSDKYYQTNSYNIFIDHPKESWVIDKYLKSECFENYGGPKKGIDY